jgi:predicted nucleic acid-binding protein
MNRALVDTSFVIALARGEELALDDPPAEAAISSVTLCGLHRGVLIARDRDFEALDGVDVVLI